MAIFSSPHRHRRETEQPQGQVKLNLKDDRLDHDIEKSNIVIKTRDLDLKAHKFNKMTSRMRTSGQMNSRIGWLLPPGEKPQCG